MLQTNSTDRQTGQERQRSNSIGRTVLQMVAQKQLKTRPTLRVGTEAGRRRCTWSITSQWLNFLILLARNWRQQN